MEIIKGLNDFKKYSTKLPPIMGRIVTYQKKGVVTIFAIRIEETSISIVNCAPIRAAIELMNILHIVQ